MDANDGTDVFGPDGSGGELRQAAPCASDEICTSGADLSVAIGAYRAGRAASVQGDFLQTFTATRAGSPIALTLSLRHLRRFSVPSTGPAATLHVGLYAVASATEPALPTGSYVATGTLDLNTFEGTRTVAATFGSDGRAEIALTATAPLAANATYGVHVWTEALPEGAQGSLLLGLGALTNGAYAGGRAFRLSRRATGGEWGAWTLRPAGSSPLALNVRLGGCTAPSECPSGVCSGGTCQAPACTDTVENGDETDVDCGGSCPAKCLDGKGCIGQGDCASGTCSAGVCGPAFRVHPASATIAVGGTLTLISSGGAAPYTYSVTSGDGSFTRSTYTTTATPGPRTLRVTDAASRTVDVPVTVSPVLAVTISAAPGRPDVPHVTYSGATHTLKGISLGNATQYLWEYGNGSMGAWTNISNPQNLSASVTYTGAPGTRYLAKLSVRDAQYNYSSAYYPIEVRHGSAAAVTTAEFDTRVAHAVEQGLWYLHVNANRSTYASGPPGWSQPFLYWSVPEFTCAAVEALARAGYKIDGSGALDPYAEDVRRGVNYIIANAAYRADLGSTYGTSGIHWNNDLLVTGRCAMALSVAGAPGWVAATGIQTNVQGKTLEQVSQLLANYFWFAQIDTTTFRGGWSFQPNLTAGSDSAYHEWSALGLASLERERGVAFASSVKSDLGTYWLTAQRNVQSSTLNGGYGMMGPTSYINPTTTGGNLAAQAFAGWGPTDSRVQAAVGYLYRNWVTPNNYGDGWYCPVAGGPSGINYSGETTYLVSSGLRRQGLTSVRDWNYTLQVASGTPFDWFYDAQVGKGVARMLLQEQSTTGMIVSDIGNWHSIPALDTGLAVSTLIGQRHGDQPRAAICDCARLPAFAAGQSISLDGACSTPSSPPHAITHYEWDLDYSPAGTFDVDATGAQVTKAGGFAASGTYSIALRVTEDGARTWEGRCPIQVTASGNRCPRPAIGGGPLHVYTGTAGQPVALSAADSMDPDGDTLSYEWATGGVPTVFSSPTGAIESVTFGTAGTYAIAVRVSDGVCPQVIGASVVVAP